MMPSCSNWHALSVLVFAFLLTAALPARAQTDGKAPFRVEDHKVFDLLDEQHIGNLLYRPGPEGGTFIGFGRTPMQSWVYGTSQQTELVPSRGEGRYTNGGDVLDVDQDGELEVVAGWGEGGAIENSNIYWFDEPQDDSTPWEEHFVTESGSGPYVAPHDIVTFEASLPSGETARGVIYNIGRDELYFAVIPNDPTQPWTVHEIGAFPEPNQSGVEIVDVNDDGRQDIVTGMFWVETPPDPTSGNWTFHRYGRWDLDNKGWGGMIQHSVADFDGDGQVEIVAAEAEIPGARIGIFDRTSDDGTGEWNERIIEQGVYAPHSVVTADLNQDGQPDFVVGEMTAAGWSFPLNPNPKIWGYVNQGGRFERHLISEGWGVHEMSVLPELRNGNVVLYGADEIQPQKFDGMRTPLNMWIISPK